MFEPWLLDWPTEAGWYWFWYSNPDEILSHGSRDGSWDGRVRRAGFHLSAVRVVLGGDGRVTYMTDGRSIYRGHEVGLWSRIKGQPPATPDVDEAIDLLRKTTAVTRGG